MTDVDDDMWGYYKDESAMGPPKEEPDCFECCDSGRSCSWCNPNRWQRAVWAVQWRAALLVGRLIPNRAVRYDDDEAPF